MGGMSSSRMTSAAKNPATGRRVIRLRVTRGMPSRVRIQDVTKRAPKGNSARREAPEGTGPPRPAAMSRVGRLSKRAGATIAPKKRAGPMASAIAARWRKRTGVSSRRLSRRIFGARRGDPPGRGAAVEEGLDCATAFTPVSAGPVVHVHPDEPVGPLPIEPAGVREGVRERILPVGEAVLDRTAEGAGDAGDAVGPEVAPHDVSSERQRGAGLFLAPLAEGEDCPKTFVGERELALVNEESGFELAGCDARLDPIERLLLGPHAR